MPMPSNSVFMLPASSRQRKATRFPRRLSSWASVRQRLTWPRPMLREESTRNKYTAIRSPDRFHSRPLERKDAISFQDAEERVLRVMTIEDLRNTAIIVIRVDGHAHQFPSVRRLQGAEPEGVGPILDELEASFSLGLRPSSL
ncbi:hypothetical protein D3C72_1463430 [compost metagenome]